MLDKFEGKTYLTPNEVAKRMMVSPVTVRGWAQRELLQAEVTPGGHRRFRREEVERFARLWNPEGNKGPLRVLIVDDDKSVVNFLKELLEGDARLVIVEIALDGFDAGRKVYTFQPNIVLLDLKMPGLSGAEVCKRIKDQPGHADIRVIGLTGQLTQKAEADMLAAGAECCLTKPIDVEQLLSKIHKNHPSIIKSSDK